jgi:hypothetical protein
MTRTSTTVRAGLAAALAALLLAGCGGASEEAAAPGGGGNEAAAPDAGGDAGGGSGGGSGQDGSGQDGSGQDGSGQDGSGGGGSAVTVPERKITRSEVTVEVDDLSRSAAQVRDVAAANGGEVTDESLGLSRQVAGYGAGAYGPDGTDVEGVPGQPAVVASPGEARLVLRVPPDAAQETVEEIAALGTETGRWTSSTSVETTLVDLESRIASQTRAVEQAQELMDRATSLADIVLLENEVNTRTAELESLKARQASIAGQAERATVTAVLQTRERTEEVASTGGFLGGLRSGWDALLASLGVLLTVVGAVLPFAVVAALVGYPLHLLLRRRRANRPVAVLAPAGPHPGWSVGPPPPAPQAPAAPQQRPQRPDAGPDERG